MGRGPPCGGRYRQAQSIMGRGPPCGGRYRQAYSHSGMASQIIKIGVSDHKMNKWSWKNAITYRNRSLKESEKLIFNIYPFVFFSPFFSSSIALRYFITSMYFIIRTVWVLNHMTLVW
jgi:hypothetical protein